MEKMSVLAQPNPTHFLVYPNCVSDVTATPAQLPYWAESGPNYLIGPQLGPTLIYKVILILE